MMGHPVHIPVEAAQAFAANALAEVGVPVSGATVASRHLVCADVRGVRTHGLTRLPVYVRRIRAGHIDPLATPTILSEDLATAWLDGNRALGQINGQRAMDLAIEKAAKAGIGVSIVRRSEHFGAAGGYAILAVEQQFVGLATTNTAPLMSPIDGTGAVIGNNPIAIAAPSPLGFPLMIDVAMSQVAAWRLVMAEQRGEEIPLGWALDRNGTPTTDPTEAFRKGGSLEPIGSHKGLGLAVLIDVLTGVLGGGAIAKELNRLEQEAPVNASHLFIALDIDRFVGTERFLERVGELAEIVRGTPKRRGASRILLPGEREAEEEILCKERGIPYDAVILQQLEELARSLGVEAPF